MFSAFPSSNGGPSLRYLLAALPHWPQPLHVRQRLQRGAPEPELQRGLHGAVLLKRLHQPGALQSHVQEVPGCRSPPLPAAPPWRRPSTGPTTGTLSAGGHRHMHRELHWGLREIVRESYREIDR